MIQTGVHLSYNRILSEVSSEGALAFQLSTVSLNRHGKRNKKQNMPVKIQIDMYLVMY